MSAKNLDKHNRWRNKTVAFRVSLEKDAQIEMAVKLTSLPSGTTSSIGCCGGMWWCRAIPGFTRCCGISWP